MAFPAHITGMSRSWEFFSSELPEPFTPTSRRTLSVLPCYRQSLSCYSMPSTTSGTRYQRWGRYWPCPSGATNSVVETATTNRCAKAKEAVTDCMFGKGGRSKETSPKRGEWGRGSNESRAREQAMRRSLQTKGSQEHEIAQRIQGMTLLREVHMGEKKGEASPWLAVGRGASNKLCVWERWHWVTELVNIQINEGALR